VATSEELYLTPTWAAPSGHARASAGVGVTVKLVVEVLLARFGSGVVEETVPVLEIVPDVLGLLTTSTIVATPLASTVPREQLPLVLVPEQDPCDAVTETIVAPAGTVSLAVTFAARPGPAFAITKL
jgi:hypothetical protein